MAFNIKTQDRGGTYEASIIAAHSTPGLQKNQFTRAAKKDHLARMEIKGEDAKKILEELYGPEED